MTYCSQFAFHFQIKFKVFIRSYLERSKELSFPRLLNPQLVPPRHRHQPKKIIEKRLHKP